LKERVGKKGKVVKKVTGKGKGKEKASESKAVKSHKKKLTTG